MAVDLTDDDCHILLLALWNWKLQNGGLNAQQEEVPVEQLTQAMRITDMIDAVASKLGGKPNRPLYGVWMPPES